MRLQFFNYAVIANSKLDYWTVYFVRAVFRFRFIACIDLYSNTKLWWAFYLPPFEYFTKLGFFWQPRSEKRLPTLFCFERAHYKVFWFVLFSFMPYANLATSPKRLETELTNIIRHFCSLPVFCIEHSFMYFLLSEFFFRYLFVLTYFDSSRRHTHATTHAAGTQTGRTKMTSFDAIFCRGNKSSSRSLARFCRRKHKKSTARASHSWKNLSSTCRQV